MDKKTEDLLVKQQYRIAGKHSAVKICTWTKNSIRDKGVCYKERFYGIKCHRCVQMSPSVGFCHNRCVFCWRPLEYNEGDRMLEHDEPEAVIERCIQGQKELLTGFGGNENANMSKLKEAMNPKHFAISLTGEPTLYPQLNELIQLLHKKGITTFVVTNGMEPETLHNIEAPTQLYLSVDAPDEELFKKIDQPTIDGWPRLMQSLEAMKELGSRTRTCLRFTAIKGLNMVRPEKWAEIISKANPKFVEVKAYMHVGFSKKRLKLENMPTHDEVLDFSEHIAESAGWKIIDQHRRSRAVLLMQEDSDDRIMDF